MMTRLLLTLLVGLVVSLGALVSGVEPVLAKNWDQSKSPDNTICTLATVRKGSVV